MKMISNPDSDTFYVGGMDISFVKGDDVNACAALVVFSFPDLEVKLSIFLITFIVTSYPLTCILRNGHLNFH